jgi:DNA-binding transcriptional regulator GbsR (MarR family)
MTAAPATEASPSQTALEDGLVEIFAELAELFGNPRSHGMIYGLLFASGSPLSLEDITRRIDISQGSASMGLRQLESFGAIVREKPEDSRHALYSAKLEMKLLIAGFLGHRVIPRLDLTESRVRELRDLIPELNPEAANIARHRLERLEKWHRSARAIFPLARKILGSG